MAGWYNSVVEDLGKIVESIPLNFIKDKAFFLKKLTATVISAELYEKYNILTSINDSSNSNHLNVSPSLIIEKQDVDYFFSSLERVLNSSLNLKSLNLIFNFIKSKLK